METESVLTLVLFIIGGVATLLAAWLHMKGKDKEAELVEEVAPKLQTAVQKAFEKKGERDGQGDRTRDTDPPAAAQ